jgi:hypothetical protein
MDEAVFADIRRHHGTGHAVERGRRSHMEHEIRKSPNVPEGRDNLHGILSQRYETIIAWTDIG